MSKNDLYNEDLIWMSYRYAIGLKPESEDDYFNVDFNSPEYHALVAEFREFLKKKKIKNVSDLLIKKPEDDLIYLSYHYAIGRHTYAVLHAGEIASHAYKYLSKARREFNAADIRREIYNRLSFGFVPFYVSHFSIHDKYCPVDMMMTFLMKEGITTIDQLRTYTAVHVSEENGELVFNCEKANTEDDINKGLYPSDYEDYFYWADLASCLDEKSHKWCRVKYNGKEQLIEYFDSWITDHNNYENGETPEIGRIKYKKVKRGVEQYLKNPNICSYICEEYIVEDNVKP